MSILLYIIIGLAAGVFSGILGIGGGTIIIPALIFFLGFSQHQAQGTTLALMVPPIGLLAAYVYYRSGYVDIKAALFIAIFFFLGGYIGARIAVHLSEDFLKKIFAIALMIIAIKMFFSK